MRLLVFGLGYSALTFVRSARGAAEAIVGTVRTQAKADALADAEDIVTIVFDGHGPSEEVRDAIDEATHILVSIPPGDAGDPVLLDHASDIASSRGLQSIVYLSTVGVYGDHGGAWVDETTEPRPVSTRSVARLATENAWRNLADGAGKPLAVLRLSGIYGPGQNALVNLAEGTARRLVKPGQVFNRIHVEDIAAAISAAFGKAADGVFNVTDDEPAPPQDVVVFAAALLGVEPPPETPFATAQLTPMARSFYGENKRVRNERLKSVLGVRLAYPSYREGLSALLARGEGAR